MKLPQDIKEIILAIVGAIIFASGLYFAILTALDYRLATRGIETSAVVLDNDFTPQNKYLVEIVDGNKQRARFIIKGYNKQSLIEKGDSARIIFDPQVRSYCHLLYFFEPDSASPEILKKRQPINERREIIATPTTFKIRVWPIILCVINWVAFVFLIIYDIRKRRRMNHPIKGST
ncbi:MAG: hypothetical protein K2J10_06960 [Muribaculaceae bacterium]|nr:hypothetical protein [Muribaculaceae bacterium]